MNIKPLGSTILHCLWNTKFWEPLLENDVVREELFNFLLSRSLVYGIKIDQINGGSEHIHCLFLNAKKEDIKPIIQTMKRDANKWLREKGYGQIGWESGYLVFSVKDDAEIIRLRQLIANQKAYHQSNSFAYELECLLAQNIQTD